MFPTASIRPPHSGIRIKGRYRRWALEHILAAEINCCVPAPYTHTAAHMPTLEFICAGIHIPACVCLQTRMHTHIYIPTHVHRNTRLAQICLHTCLLEGTQKVCKQVMMYIQHMCQVTHEHTGVDNPTYKFTYSPRPR